MKCVAIDDEPIALRILKEFCRRAGDLELTVFTDAAEGLSHILEARPEIIFLDIEMKGFNGLDLAPRMPEKSCIIFTTAYMQYALEGFNLDAVDFLHKPFSFERFMQAIAKVKRRMGYSSDSEPVSVIVKQDYNNVPVTLSDILYVEAMENYSKIHLKSGKTIVAHNSMKALSELLPESRFMRIHKSYIVPLSDIGHFTRQNISLKDGTLLPVGRQFSSVLFQKFSS